MSKPLIFLLIIGAVFIFVLGGGIGVLYQTQQSAPQVEKLQTIEASIKGLSSKVIPSINAYGQVTKIEGRNITLDFKGEILTLKIKDDAQILSFVKLVSSEENTSGIDNQQTDFEEIKNGDNLNISIKFLPEGTLEGQSVIILPTVPPQPAQSR